MFLEISQSSQEETCARVFFLIKLQALGLRPATLLKKRLWHRFFSFEFWEISKKIFLTEHLWTTASVYTIKPICLHLILNFWTVIYARQQNDNQFKYVRTRTNRSQLKKHIFSQTPPVAAFEGPKDETFICKSAELNVFFMKKWWNFIYIEGRNYCIILIDYTLFLYEPLEFRWGSLLLFFKVCTLKMLLFCSYFLWNILNC